MKEEFQHNSRAPAEGHMSNVTLTRGIGFGVIGSLAGTLVMDLVMVGEFSMMGLPALTYLDLIGSVFGGGIPLGVLVHVLTGSVLGVIFSVPVLTIDALRIDSVRKGLVLGILVGLASISACVPFAILIGEKIATVLSFMTIPHLVWGIVLGVVAGYGLRSRR
jgi:hypothetical protein